jgi:hypothetical protein
MIVNSATYHVAHFFLDQKRVRHGHVIWVWLLYRVYAKIGTRDEPSLVSCRVHDTPDIVCGRSLAFGSGDTNDYHFARGETVCGGCNESTRFVVCAHARFGDQFFYVIHTMGKS